MNIIIVHNKERTVKLSAQIARKQGKVYLIHNKPFSKTLKDAFRLALKLEDEWMVLIGGDQLLFPGAIKRIEREIESADKNIFRISSTGYDHLWMQERLMAPCAYRVSLLKEALDINCTNKKRPETFIMSEMNKRGHSNIIIEDIIVEHDKEQYYKDIYIKGYNQAKKSDINFLKETLKNSNNPDHRVFLWGILNGEKKNIGSTKTALKRNGVREKKPL